MVSEVIHSEYYWFSCKDGNEDARRLYHRHYSRYVYKDGRHPKKIVGPGEYMMLITNSSDALFVWRYSKFGDKNGQKGVNCAIFRNETKIKSSTLIKKAVELAQRRWPGKRLYTYVNPLKIRSTNPGYCFLQAGWRKCGMTKKSLLILDYQSIVD